MQKRYLLKELLVKKTIFHHLLTTCHEHINQGMHIGM